MISAVMITLNGEQRLAATLASLAPAAIDGFVREVIVADRGSTDATLAVAEDAGARIVTVAAGRPGLASACEAARQPWLLILAVGSRLQLGWEEHAHRHVREHPRAAG